MAERPSEGSQDADDGTAPYVESGRTPRPKPKNAAPTWVGMSGLGFEFVGAILVPGALGWWLDRQFGTGPWVMLALGLLGFVVGLRLLMRSVNRSDKR